MIDFYNSPRHRLIVSADDFGVSPRANRNIRFLISLGKIDRVGIMSYGKFSEKDLEEITRGTVKIDIHLDILHKFHTERTKRESVFLRGMEFLGKLIVGKISAKKVEHDWREQIEKFREIFGKNPDGISSHEHVHFFPPFFNIALKLQNEYSIPFIRFGNNTFMLPGKPAAHVLNWAKLFDRKSFRKNGCVSSESFISLDWIDDMDEFFNILPEGTIEIACHPEIADDFVRIKKYF